MSGRRIRSVHGTARSSKIAVATDPRVRLFLYSALTLFVELALIRWDGANVIYLGWFSNFVLLASFLGLGLGFLRSSSKRDLSAFAPVVLGLAILIVFVALVEARPPDDSQVIYFSATTSTGPPVWIILPAVFALVTVVTLCLGEGIARSFAKLRALDAYRYDILGSVTGSAAFGILQFVQARPVAWGLVACAAFCVLEWPLADRARARPLVAGVALILVTLGFEAFAPNTYWSPYSKLVVFPLQTAFGTLYGVTANGVPHQVAQPWTALQHYGDSFYTRPYTMTGRTPNRVLIIGAGTGTDVNAALHLGAQHVDAVEIDPGLYKLGYDLHTDHPYSDPRVTVIIDDGRAFLERTTGKYDVIVLSQPDSLQVVSGQSGLRLESYLFTIEADRQARAHLARGGVFAEWNYYHQSWLVDRMAGTLQEAFGHPPCVSLGSSGAGQAFLIIGLQASDVNCTTTYTALDPPVAAPPTDDRPFLYVRTESVPSFYALVLAILLLVSLMAVWVTGTHPMRMRPYMDLFFLGAAFTLIETKSVVQFALLFGTTWTVNTFVFIGILAAVFAAIEMARRIRLPHLSILFVILGATLAVALLVPPEWLLRLPFWPRVLAACAIAFLPVTAANLIFAERFKLATSTTTAFATNLLGAMVGGALEYLALVTGYRNLVLLAAALYVAAYLSQRLPLRRTG